MGCTHPPTTTKEQTARLPLIFNLSLSCPACPRGVGHGASTGSRGWGGTPGFAQGDCRSPLSSRVPHLTAGSELRTQRMGRVWDMHSATPSPTGSRALPPRRPCKARPHQRLDWGEGREGGTVAVPAPRPQHHLPSATYRGSSSSRGRGRSSSERSVRPTVPLKGASTNQRALEESGGDRSCSQNLPERPEEARALCGFSLKLFLNSAVGKEPRAVIWGRDGFLTNESPPPKYCRKWTSPVGSIS